jgi:hypothetical protein
VLGNEERISHAKAVDMHSRGWAVQVFVNLDWVDVERFGEKNGRPRVYFAKGNGLIGTSALDFYYRLKERHWNKCTKPASTA